jgi:hypothetical protein
MLAAESLSWRPACGLALLLAAALTAVPCSAVAAATAASSAPPPPPVWPFQWNSTQVKINPFNTDIRWTKFYYDWTQKASRFDFYNGYFSTNNDWQLNCTVLFTGGNIWFVFPDEQACNLDHAGIGPVDPNWLQASKYNQTALLKGVWADQYLLDTGPLGVIEYWARADASRLPLRSTNQNNDPGATDYVDVVLGPQDSALFVLPAFCSKHTDSECG